MDEDSYAHDACKVDATLMSQVLLNQRDSGLWNVDGFPAMTLMRESKPVHHSYTPGNRQRSGLGSVQYSSTGLFEGAKHQVVGGAASGIALCSCMPQLDFCRCCSCNLLLLLKTPFPTPHLFPACDPPRCVGSRLKLLMRLCWSGLE